MLWGKEGFGGEIPSEHPTVSPAQVCSAYRGHSLFCCCTRRCTAFYRDPHCHHCGAFSLAWKGSTVLMLGAVEKRLGGIKLLRMEG